MRAGKRFKMVNMAFVLTLICFMIMFLIMVIKIKDACQTYIDQQMQTTQSDGQNKKQRVIK